ncbi:glycosyltransferase [Flavihumibacter solisilvae]|uniref:Glycosyl transferase family 1 domain-containing protein n=1 Tax=Flavihumibacter solisilvae TaxID=1349421 RepID=A0A0C1LH75_9BACT|nr:glycosyltransferase [Flavihumibacter solisilvae]KIC94658.1 hypothetical protein OI18_11280 [Flavihumibacter solisilvae]
MMQIEEQRFLFLYTRLPEYFYQCILQLVQRNGGQAKALIYCYPKDANAPYELSSLNGNITVCTKEQLDLQAIAEFNPSLIYIAGWGDKTYNRIASSFGGSIPVIIGMDNPWKGTIRQRIASIVGRLWLKKMATFIWIPGYPQFEFGRRLGFHPSRILKGLYCADVEPYESLPVTFHKRILFVGRLVDFKRPDWVLEAFSNIIKQYPALADWKLTLVGNGPMEKELRARYGQIPQIEFVPFVQPNLLPAYYESAGVFCLPSDNEHWGVVVHEAASAGLSLLLSDTCGAATEFLIPTFNGLIFKSLSSSDFQNRLFQLLSLPESELLEMGKNSRIIARRVNKEMWVSTILGSLENKS